MGILMLNGNNYTGGIQQVYGSSSGDIATFDDGGDNKPLKSLKVAINPVQSGSGVPSPSNVRPISGWDEVKVNVSPTQDAEDGTTYTIQLGNTCYGGKLDVTSGVLTVDMASVDLGNLTWTYDSTYKYFYTTDLVYNYGSKMPNYNIFCELYKCLTAEESAQLSDVTKDTIMVVVFHAHNNSLNIRNLAYTDAATFKTAMSGVYLVYELATPITYQLTPTQIKSLLGNNNIWSDTGEILECVYQRDLNIVINQFDARITALEQALNSSGTRSLSLSKSAVKEEETEEITEEPKEEEQNEDKR